MQVAFTHRLDFARFLAHSLATLPLSSLANSTHQIRGDQKALLDVVHIYESTHPGTKVHVEHLSFEETLAAAMADQSWGGFLKYLGCYTDEGRFRIRDEEASNDFLEGMEPQECRGLCEDLGLTLLVVKEWPTSFSFDHAFLLALFPPQLRLILLQ